MLLHHHLEWRSSQMETWMLQLVFKIILHQPTDHHPQMLQTRTWDSHIYLAKELQKKHLNDKIYTNTRIQNEQGQGPRHLFTQNKRKISILKHWASRKKYFCFWQISVILLMPAESGGHLLRRPLRPHWFNGKWCKFFANHKILSTLNICN